MPFNYFSSAPKLWLTTAVLNLKCQLWFQMCRLIVSEIITSPCNASRVQIIGRRRTFQGVISFYFPSSEKWTAVADICRCLHNYNGVLQVCAAFTNSSVYRLRKTWRRIGKTVKRRVEYEGIFNIYILDKDNYWETTSNSKQRWKTQKLERCSAQMWPSQHSIPWYLSVWPHVYWWGNS